MSWHQQVGRSDSRGTSLPNSLDEAEKLAAGTTNPFTQALIFAGLRDKERTLEALNRMTVLGPVRIGSSLTFPELDLIRGDPRLKALRKKVGLPE